MTFDELRARIGATRPAAVESSGYFELPEITLSELRQALGPPLQQKINDAGIADVRYAIDGGGECAIVARSMGLLQRLTGGVVFLRTGYEPEFGAAGSSASPIR